MEQGPEWKSSEKPGCELKTDGSQECANDLLLIVRSN